MLEVNNLKFSYGSVDLFQSVEFKIFPGEHVGLVGKNGSGKTTLMNLLAYRLSPDEGTIAWDKAYEFSYLDQHLEVYDDLTIQEYLYSVYLELFQKEEELNKLYESMAEADPEDYDKILRKCDLITIYLEERNFYRIKSNIGNIVNGLGISMESNQVLARLSGGQRAKIFLGKMLLEEKQVLLLDEPTNFLDAAHVEWLSKYLVSYKHAFLVISHNQDFLNQVCSVILDLDNKRIIKYKGNYDAFVRQKAELSASYEKEYEKQQKYIKKTEEFIQKNIVRATTTKRAQSRRKMLEKMDVLDKPVAEKQVHFSFPFTKTFNSDALVVKNLTIGYDKPILENLNHSFSFGEKYVITGKNGVGKTTFVKTILGEIPSLHGNVRLSVHNNISYFKQEDGTSEENAIEYFRNKYPLLTDQEIRSILAKYAIVGEDAIKPMSSLSGGERCKVRFARLSLEDSNLLVLDEPTNHLDKAAKKSLFTALASYPGTVILVSHEKSFYKQLGMKEIKF